MLVPAAAAALPSPVELLGPAPPAWYIPASMTAKKTKAAEAREASTAAEAAVASDLTRRVAAGDRTAEEELVERYSRGVLFLLRRLSGRPDLAEDLHQETFRVVLERLRKSGIEDPARLVGFVQGTARRLFLGERRKHLRRKTDAAGDDLPDGADPAPSQLDSTLRDERAALVRRMLADLRPERDRRVLYRFYLAEEDKEHICRDLGLSHQHFNRVVYRARQRFKGLLEGSPILRRATGAA